MTIEHDKMFIISVQLHVLASIRILLCLTVICLFILYSTMHNGMCDLKKKYFSWESSVCGAAESEGRPALACSQYRHVLLWSLQNDSIGACSINGDILIVSGLMMEGVEGSQSSRMLCCFTALMAKKISKEFPPPPPSIFQGLMPMNSEPLKTKGRWW